MTTVWNRWTLMLRWIFASEWMEGRNQRRLPVDSYDRKMAAFFTVLLLLIVVTIVSTVLS